MRVRKPSPPALRVLRGDRPRTRLANDSAPGIPPKPKTIVTDPVASAEWDRMAGLLRARGVLSQADLGILVVYCDAFSRLVAALAELAREGLIVSTELEFRGNLPVSFAARFAASLDSHGGGTT
jgi:phage terminase small subunit